MSNPPPSTEEEYGVTTLELFFDLVFVFVITQLTSVLVAELSLLGLLRVTLMFVALWWMYSGYAWLTNTRTPVAAGHRLLLLVGMGGFLLVALATPHAFDGGGAWWGVGYLIVVLVHGGLYLQFTPKFIRVLPANLIAAGCVIATGFVDGALVYVLWALAVFIPIAMPYIVPPGGRFLLQASHIVERHGLLVLITFGESVVAIGIGVAGQDLDLELAQAALLGLALVAALWWTYFAGDDERTERALAMADSGRRTQMVMYGYFYAHIPILIGVIAMAAGIKKAMGHMYESLHAGPSVALAGGLALYLLGDVWFRRIMGIGPSATRPAAAALALATIPLGAVVAELQVVVLVAILAGALVLERRPAE
ncbi:MAG TPA: low temperature requirement protein A [Streptosporangiaceae bacterium]|jgi:low temperature requirement protein LtrA